MFRWRAVSVWLSDVPHQVDGLEQAYDFSCGELTSRFRFRAANRIAMVEVVTFCSRVDPSLACQEIMIEAGGGGDVGVQRVLHAGRY
jgi:hypothetical protein